MACASSAGPAAATTARFRVRAEATTSSAGGAPASRSSAHADTEAVAPAGAQLGVEAAGVPEILGRGEPARRLLPVPHPAVPLRPPPGSPARAAGTRPRPRSPPATSARPRARAPGGPLAVHVPPGAQRLQPQADRAAGEQPVHHGDAAPAVLHGDLPLEHHVADPPPPPRQRRRSSSNPDRYSYPRGATAPPAHSCVASRTTAAGSQRDDRIERGQPERPPRGRLPGHDQQPVIAPRPQPADGAHGIPAPAVGDQPLPQRALGETAHTHAVRTRYGACSPDPLASCRARYPLPAAPPPTKRPSHPTSPSGPDIYQPRHRSPAHRPARRAHHDSRPFNRRPPRWPPGRSKELRAVNANLQSGKNSGSSPESTGRIITANITRRRTWRGLSPPSEYAPPGSANIKVRRTGRVYEDGEPIASLYQETIEKGTVIPQDRATESTMRRLCRLRVDRGFNHGNALPLYAPRRPRSSGPAPATPFPTRIMTRDASITANTVNVGGHSTTVSGVGEFVHATALPAMDPDLIARAIVRFAAGYAVAAEATMAAPRWAGTRPSSCGPRTAGWWWTGQGSPRTPTAPAGASPSSAWSPARSTSRLGPVVPHRVRRGLPGRSFRLRPARGGRRPGPAPRGQTALARRTHQFSAPVRPAARHERPVLVHPQFKRSAVRAGRRAGRHGARAARRPGRQAAGRQSPGRADARAADRGRQTRGQAGRAGGQAAAAGPGGRRAASSRVRRRRRSRRPRRRRGGSGPAVLAEEQLARPVGRGADRLDHRVGLVPGSARPPRRGRRRRARPPCPCQRGPQRGQQDQRPLGRGGLDDEVAGEPAPGRGRTRRPAGCRRSPPPRAARGRRRARRWTAGGQVRPSQERTRPPASPVRAAASTYSKAVG